MLHVFQALICLLPTHKQDLKCLIEHQITKLTIKHIVSFVSQMPMETYNCCTNTKQTCPTSTILLGFPKSLDKEKKKKVKSEIMSLWACQLVWHPQLAGGSQLCDMLGYFLTLHYLRVLISSQHSIQSFSSGTFLTLWSESSKPL